MSQLHEQAAMSSAYISQQDRAQRSAEAWTETLEAWAARLDAAKLNVNAIDSLLSDIENECGQCEAWRAVYLYADGLEFHGLVGGANLSAARDAILAIPQPEHE